MSWDLKEAREAAGGRDEEGEHPRAGHQPVKVPGGRRSSIGAVLPGPRAQGDERGQKGWRGLR